MYPLGSDDDKMSTLPVPELHELEQSEGSSRNRAFLSDDVTDLGMISWAVVLTVKSRIWLSAHCIDGW